MNDYTKILEIIDTGKNTGETAPQKTKS